MTIRRITEAERLRDAEIRRDTLERAEVQWAFADWVTERSVPLRDGRRTVHVPPLSEEMIARLRALLSEEKL